MDRKSRVVGANNLSPDHVTALRMTGVKGLPMSASLPRDLHKVASRGSDPNLVGSSKLRQEKYSFWHR